VNWKQHAAKNVSPTVLTDATDKQIIGVWNNRFGTFTQQSVYRIRRDMQRRRPDPSRPESCVECGIRFEPIPSLNPLRGMSGPDGGGGEHWQGEEHHECGLVGPVVVV
jgi:hypothetical protein